jgi:hypothetical protein
MTPAFVGWHPEDGGSSVLRNVCNHLSYGVVALKNTLWTVSALELRVFSTALPRSISTLYPHIMNTLPRHKMTKYF